MNDFKLLVDYLFNLFGSIWNLINSHWILQLFFMIGLFGLIVQLTVQVSPKE